MTELIPGLFIGNWHEARSNVGMYKITVAGDSEFVGAEWFKLIDGPGNSVDALRAAIEATVDAHKRGERVLVHCIGGRSRSAAVIVGAAVRLTGRPFCDVYDDLLKKHDGTGTGARIHPHLSVLLLEILE